MALALPRHLVEEEAQYRAELMAMSVLNDELKHWTRELKEINERLQLVWAPENVEHPALVPGRYHIIELQDPPTPPNVIPLVGEITEDEPGGTFREPGSWMFDMLKQNDHWSDRSRAVKEKYRAEAEAARLRAVEREKQEMADELDERIKNVMNPSVSMSRTKRQWANRAHARRAR